MRMKVKAKGGLNVHSEPSEWSPVVRVLRSGKEVDVSRIERGWAKVSGGWCLARFLEEADRDREAWRGEEAEESVGESAERAALADLADLADSVSRIVDD